MCNTTLAGGFAYAHAESPVGVIDLGSAGITSGPVRQSRHVLSFIIAPGYDYRVAAWQNNGTVTLSYWTEVRL